MAATCELVVWCKNKLSKGLEHVLMLGMKKYKRIWKTWLGRPTMTKPKYRCGPNRYFEAALAGFWLSSWYGKLHFSLVSVTNPIGAQKKYWILIGKICSLSILIDALHPISHNNKCWILIEKINCCFDQIKMQHFLLTMDWTGSWSGQRNPHNIYSLLYDFWRAKYCWLTQELRAWASSHS